MEKIYEQAIVDIIKNIRTIKRQLLIIRPVDIDNETKTKLIKAFANLEREIRLFRL